MRSCLIVTVLDLVSDPARACWYAMLCDRRGRVVWSSDVKGSEEEAINQVQRYLHFFYPDCVVVREHRSGSLYEREQQIRRINGEPVLTTGARAGKQCAEIADFLRQDPIDSVEQVQRKLW